jgi:hypothetical protein
MSNELYERLISLVEKTYSGLMEVKTAIASIESELKHRPDDEKVISLIQKGIEKHERDKHAKPSMMPTGPLVNIEAGNKWHEKVNWGLLVKIAIYIALGAAGVKGIDYLPPM